MRWDKSSPSAQTRPKPYQGVRVKDPVKELLRRKRSLELPCTKTAPPAADVVAPNSQSSYVQGVFGSGVAGGSSGELSLGAGGGGMQGVGWKAAPVTRASGQPAGIHWPLSDYSQQERQAPTPAYSATPTLTADVYMQTLCPSYTMLTYAHTPLLTNFGPIPVAPASASLPQMELPDSGMTYLPWAQSLTTISANPGVQLSANPSGLPGSPMVHMPLSMSLTTMATQLEATSVDVQPQEQGLPKQSDHHLDPEHLDPEGHSLDEDPGVEPESPNLLDKLLEDQRGDSGEEDSYSSHLFHPHV
ncbi:uncharacterized protein V6R79_009142 [Siganus canaliculatus]